MLSAIATLLILAAPGQCAGGQCAVPSYGYTAPSYGYTRYAQPASYRYATPAYATPSYRAAPAPVQYVRAAPTGQPGARAIVPTAPFPMGDPADYFVRYPDGRRAKVHGILYSDGTVHNVNGSNRPLEIVASSEPSTLAPSVCPCTCAACTCR